MLDLVQTLRLLELAQNIKEIVNFSGKIRFDPSQPDGTLENF